MAEKRKLAFYIRLSDADEEVKAGTKDESNSITGQRKLLYAYIKKTEEFAGFEVLEYFDDGYSGTMFNNRAEFQRLIQDAELGRFECIIVKDFSRFGRDYLEVGNYEFQCSMYTEAPLSKTQDGKDWRMSADFYAEVRSTGQGAGNHKGNL